MADVLTPQQRTYNMSRIRSRDTKPEKVVRSMVHKLGFRFALHKRDLPGTPDIALVRHKKVIDVYGCFFHMHSCRYGRVTPATNAEFWQSKRQTNFERDKVTRRRLRRLGWNVLVIWECETRRPDALESKLRSFLGMRKD